MATKVTDEEFVQIWMQSKSPLVVSQTTGITVRAVYRRRNSLVAKGYDLPTVLVPHSSRTFIQHDTAPQVHFEKNRNIDLKDGTVIIFSDPHFYPDSNTIAQKAILTLIKELKPKVVLCGGDALDGTQISRHDPTRGWHQPPTIREQLECLTQSMTEIKKAAKGAITYMTLGNHDARLSRYLAVNAPHSENLPGTRLEDYIPSWALSWTVTINQNKYNKGLVLRHRNLGGMLHLQAQKAGCHYAHGHLHKLGCMITPQYGRFLYSIDCGSFADPQSDAFDYMEGAPQHVQGFVVLTYKNGELLMPEFCYILDGVAFFRGKVV